MISFMTYTIQLVDEEACHLGLHMNHKKTEMIYDNPSASNLILSVSSDLSVVSRNQATLLSTPLGCTNSIDAAISL